MSDGDEALSKRYRDLAREEPSSALDAAILAASRRDVARPSLSRRWGAPISIAAVLVLAFGLTLEMKHEKPDVSTSVPAASPAPSPAAAAAPVAAPPPPPQSAREVLAKPEARRAVGRLRADAPVESKAMPSAKESAARDEMQAAPAVETRPAPAQPAAAAASPPPVRYAPSADSNVAPAAPARAKSAVGAAESASKLAVAPEQELEHIAKLRGDGQDDEADRALDDFRRRYPGYRIPEAMWERVKPR